VTTATRGRTARKSGESFGLSGAAYAVAMRRLLPLLVAGCASTWEEMPVRQVCDDVGFAVAARTMACTGDADLAQRREEDLLASYDCTVVSLDEPIDRYYHCPVAVQALTCPEVRAAGDDLASWLDASWVCGHILEPLDAP